MRFSDRCEETFNQILQAAITGARCPTSDCLSGGSRAVSTLAHDGRILVEVFIHNFRRVTILQGEHRGKTTANPPKRSDGSMPKPYVIVSKDGTFCNGRQTNKPTGYSQPSAPRPIGGI